MKKNQFVMYSIIVALILLGITVFASSSLAVTKGGIFKRGYETDAHGLGDPTAVPFTYADFRMALPAIETLFRFDKTGRPIPWLVKSYKVSDDMKSITLMLNEGVKFHDGTAFDATAVKWNLDRYCSSTNTELRAVESVEVLSDHTLRLNLSKWDSSVIGSLGGKTGMIISPAAYQKAGQTDKERAEWAVKNPVGTGAFKFVSWQRDVKLKYEKFNDYWQKGMPYLDGIEFIIIKDLMTLQASFRSGEVDEVSNLLPKDARELEAVGKFKSSLCELSSIGFGVMGDSNHPDSPFADVRVRRAIAHAVDAEAMLEAFTLGYGKLCDQFAAPGSWGRNPNVVGYEYNPEKAKRLLAEAGYPQGFKTKIMTLPMGYYVHPPTAMQNYLAKVGIKAEVEVFNPGKWQQTLRGGWQNDLLVSAGSFTNPDVTLNLISNFSSRAPMASTVQIPQDVEDAINKAEAAADFENKQKWTWEAQKLIIDKYALISIFFSYPRIAYMYKNINGTGIGETVDMFWTPESAWIEK